MPPTDDENSRASPGPDAALADIAGLLADTQRHHFWLFERICAVAALRRPATRVFQRIFDELDELVQRVEAAREGEGDASADAEPTGDDAESGYAGDDECVGAQESGNDADSRPGPARRPSPPPRDRAAQLSSSRHLAPPTGYLDNKAYFRLDAGQPRNHAASQAPSNKTFLQQPDSEVSSVGLSEPERQTNDTTEQGTALSLDCSAAPEVRVAPSAAHASSGRLGEPHLDANRDSNPESVPASAATPTVGTSQSAPTGIDRKGKARARKLDDDADDTCDRDLKRRRTRGGAEPACKGDTCQNGSGERNGAQRVPGCSTQASRPVHSLPRRPSSALARGAGAPSDVEVTVVVDSIENVPEPADADAPATPMPAPAPALPAPAPAHVPAMPAPAPVPVAGPAPAAALGPAPPGYHWVPPPPPVPFGAVYLPAIEDVLAALPDPPYDIALAPIW